MPVLANARKALRVSKRKAAYNTPVKSKMLNLINKMRRKPDEKLLPDLFSAVDKALKRNIIHRNKAARLKSKMSRLVTS